VLSTTSAARSTEHARASTGGVQSGGASIGTGMRRRGGALRQEGAAGCGGASRGLATCSLKGALQQDGLAGREAEVPPRVLLPEVVALDVDHARQRRRVRGLAAPGEHLRARTCGRSRPRGARGRAAPQLVPEQGRSRGRARLRSAVADAAMPSSHNVPICIKRVTPGHARLLCLNTVGSRVRAGQRSAPVAQPAVQADGPTLRMCCALLATLA